MESDNKEPEVAENIEKNCEDKTKLKDHQVALFEKCKYTETVRTNNNLKISEYGEQ